MNPLSSQISDDRYHLFVGREAECRWLEDWLKSTQPPTRVVAITGIGGVGKSSLVLHLGHIAHRSGAATAWVDGRTCYRTPNGFLESLPPSFYQWRQSVDRTGQSMVLAIDNYEDIHVLEAWLREVFLPELPDTGLLVLVASRRDLMGQWRVDPGWQNRLTHWTIDSFTPDEVEDFLSRQHWPVAEITMAQRLSLGHPLSLAVIAESRRRAGPERKQMALSLRDTLSAGLLREITDPDLQPLVDALSVMMEANLDLLRRVLQTKIRPEKYQALKGLSFVKPTAYGVALHDIAAKYLFDELRQRDPSEFERIRQHAVTVVLNEWDRVPAGQQGRLAQHLLWLCRDVFEDITSFADLSYNASGLQVTEYHSDDYDFARQFIIDWGRQSLPIPIDQSLSLFDLLQQEFPQSIRVTRRQDGRPLAIFVALRLYDETLALLARYHSEFVDKLLNAGLDIQPSSVEKANASLNVLVGIDKRQTTYAPQQILGVVARDQFSFQASILGLLLLTNPEIKHFLGAIGYQRIPFPVSHDPSLEEDLFVLDLRGQHIGRWIRQVLARQIQNQVSPTISSEDVRYFLSHFGNEYLLAEARLTTTLRVDWKEIEQQLTALIRHRSPPVSERDQTILELAFLNPLGSAWKAAELLHISRATFYRYQDQAVGHLTTALTATIT